MVGAIGASRLALKPYPHRREAALKAWETIRRRRMERMTDEEWEEEERAQERMEQECWVRRIRSLVLKYGGINDRDYNRYVPLWLRRKTGWSLELVIEELQNHGVWVKTPERLLALLKGG